jgi:hypothetical protein
MFVPCQKVLFSEAEKSTSVISIIEIVRVGLPASVTEIPKGTTIPLYWDLLTLWYGQPDDLGVVYEQKIALLTSSPETPDLLGEPGTSLGQESIHEFSMNAIGERRPIYQNLFQFPIWHEGSCDLKLLVRRKGQAEWRERATYPIEIEYVRGGGPLTGVRTSQPFTTVYGLKPSKPDGETSE